MNIFISSTLADLAAHRQAVVDAIKNLELDYFDASIVGAEFGEARAVQLSEYVEQLSGVDLFILILGWRYGYVPENSEESVVEIEYEEAKKSARNILCFVIDDRFPIPPKFVETGSSAAKLRRFKERVSQENIVHLFGSPEDIALKVSTSLTRYWGTPLSDLAQTLLDMPEISEWREERTRNLELIQQLQERLRSIVPASPIWRSRNFSTDTSLGFCILPFQDQFLQVYERAIIPALENAGLRALHAGQIFDNREIMEDIWESICRSRLIVADVTLRNPNVFYELGICHTLGKEVIVITQNADDVPFDIKHRRYILYEESKLLSLKDTLQQTIQRVLVRTAL